VTERWEVRASDPAEGHVVSYSLHPATVNGPAHARDGARRAAHDYRERGLVPVVVHVRTCRVEVVYAWRAKWTSSDRDHGDWWSRWSGSDVWMSDTTFRVIYTDPLGKNSRKRAKKAALAAKPSGPCVLVAVRRRVKE